jgi:hypothetical protein
MENQKYWAHNFGVFVDIGNHNKNNKKRLLKY